MAGHCWQLLASPPPLLLYCPAGQLYWEMQAALPAAAVVWPLGHWVQDPAPLAEVKPALHGVQLELPAAAEEPAGQVVGCSRLQSNQVTCIGKELRKASLTMASVPQAFTLPAQGVQLFSPKDKVPPG